MPATYPERILEHYRNPRNKGGLEGATHTGHAVNPLCGDEVGVQLRVTDGRVEAAAFDGVGCAISLAAASLLTEAWKAQGLEAVLAWDLPQVVDLLGVPVAPARERCALVAVHAMRDALAE